MAIFSSTDTGDGVFGNPREFRCTGGESVMLEALCDGFNNCTSGEDERNLLCESKLYSSLRIKTRIIVSRARLTWGKSFVGPVRLTFPQSEAGARQIIVYARILPEVGWTSERPAAH